MLVSIVSCGGSKLRYQLITLDYNGKTRNIDIWARGEDNKVRKIEVQGFLPYFYTSNLNIDIGSLPSEVRDAIVRLERGYKSIFGEPLLKITMTDPASVGKYRNHFVPHYEADIPFERRFLIDTGIYNGFEIRDNLTTIPWQEIKPCNYVNSNLRCVTLDIEVKTKWRFPDPKHANEMVTAVSLHDNFTNKYVTLIVDQRNRKEWWSPDHLVWYIPTEKELFDKLASYLEYTQPDVIRGWNIFFDLDYLRGPYIGSNGGRARVLAKDLSVIDHSAHFDQLEGYRHIFRKSSNHLKDVAVDEGFAEPGDIIADGRLLYDSNRDTFIKYSHDDVKYCVQIDEKHRLTQYFWRFKIFCGLERFSEAMFHSVKVDTLMLRHAKKQGYVLPSKREYNGDNEGYKGAVVFDPIPGLYENIAVFDMSRFYPSIIMAYHLSPERSDGNGIYQKVITELLELRNYYDKELERIAKEFGSDNEQYKSIKEERQVAKDLLNSVYGYAGQQESRLFNKQMAAKVTEVARTILSKVKQTVESKFGYKVVYGDTDSILINIPFDKYQEVEDFINETLKQHCIQDSVDPILKIKFEKYYKKILFVETKSDEERGAKKHYGAFQVYPINELVIRGFDRRDSSRIGRKVRKHVLEMILKGEQNNIIPYIKEIISNIKANKYDLNDICINTGLTKNPESYSSRTTYVRGSLYAKQHLNVDIRGGDVIKIFPIKKMPPNYPPTDVVCVLDASQLPQGTEIDYDEIIRTTLQIKLENILKIVNIQWSDVDSRFVHRSVLTAFMPG